MAVRKAKAKKAPTRKKTARKKKPSPSKAKTRSKGARNATPTSKRAPRSRKRERGKPDRGGAPSIDWTSSVVETIEALAGFGNPVEDIAVLLGVSKSALESAVADETGPVRAAFHRGKARLRDGIRTSQVKTAKEGNASMLKWLGVNLLGQRDVKAVEITGTGEDGSVKLDADLGPVLERRLGEFLRSRGKK